VAAPWQRTEEDPKTKTGTVTDGVMVITCVAVFGPPQPSALAVTVVVAIQPATYVTAPLEAFIVLPPARLAASALAVEASTHVANDRGENRRELCRLRLEFQTCCPVKVI